MKRLTTLIIALTLIAAATAMGYALPSAGWIGLGINAAQTIPMEGLR